VETKEETKQLQANSVELQRLDDDVVGQLDWLTGDKHGLTKESHAVLMRNVVMKLKEQEATTFDEAFNHPNLKLRAKYREGIHKEFRKMTERKVWRKLQRNDIPEGRRCVKCKWVFIKRNGIFRCRLVACGYSQIPGVDFTETYSPVINDITWRILIIFIIVMGFHSMIIDVETAFLYGEFEEGEEIYMECPKGMPRFGDECLLLQKTIYGLVQSGRQYFKKFTSVLTKLGFEGGQVDPCLMMKKSDKGIVYIAIYVDDCLMVGDKAAIDDAIAGLKKSGFNLKEDGSLQDYLSCEVTLSKDKKQGWIHQPHLIKNLEKKFGPLVNKLQEYGTPGTPRSIIVKDSQQNMSNDDQKLYRSGVGMLLYLVKHSRPDIANGVRELSKALDGVTPKAMQEMKRMIKYVLDTKDLALKIKPILDIKDAWSMVAFSDSDYATDPETRISISGYVLYLRGVPISWRSKGQKSVTLSSTEAEYIAMSECAKEIKFVHQLLTSMGIKLDSPIVVRVDNVGAIFMGENISISQRTKHVDVRAKFVTEMIVEGILKVIFVRSEDNDADIFTKNLAKDLHQEHARKMIEPKEELSLIGLSGESPERPYNGRKGIGQYRRGLSVGRVMSQVVSQNGGTRLDGSIGFGETQGNSETPGEVRRTSGEYG
jgi:hypothetical protein